MKGYQLQFFTEENRRHEGVPLHKWLVEKARSLGIRGATSIVAAAGYGHDGRMHAASLFELADQPVEVAVIASEDEAEQLLSVLREARIQLFFVKQPVEFGQIGTPD